MEKFILSADWIEGQQTHRAFNTHSFSHEGGKIFETDVFYKMPVDRETTIVGALLNPTQKPELLFIEVWNEFGFANPMMRLYSLKHEVKFPNEQLPLGGYTGTVSLLDYGNNASVVLARELMKGALAGQTLRSTQERNFALMARLYAAK